MKLDKRGASVTGYGLMVGLVAVVALGAISTTGGRVNDLFGKTGSTLESVANDASQALPDPSTSPSPSTQTACAAQYSNGNTTSGVYSIDPTGSSPFDVWCEMDIDGGGWTHAMTANVDDGNGSYFAESLWTSAGTVGSNSNRFSNDFKGQAAHDLTGNAILIVVRKAAAADGADGSDLKGWRSWNFDTPKTVQAMFDVSIGSYNANASGSCNSGYAGDGRIQTSSVKSNGQCASYTHPTYGAAEDTFTCYANNLYSNSEYGNCETHDRFRLSSWYRWANNSNVGLGLQMDCPTCPYRAEAGVHLAIDTYANPQRYCVNAASGCVNTYSYTNSRIVPGNDHAGHQNTIGESWRYEIYVK